MKKNWNGFAKKTIQERLEFVKSQALTSIESQESLEQNEKSQSSSSGPIE